MKGSESPQDVPLYHRDYFELKVTETLRAEEKLLPAPFPCLEALSIISYMAGQTTHY